MSENKSVPMSEYEWDGICEKKKPTPKDGTAEFYKSKLERFHEKRNAYKREKIRIDAFWYLLIAIGFGVISICMQGKWQIAGIILTAVVGMISAYGFGMARGMGRK